MTKAASRTTLYRLIEAGAIARAAVLAPLAGLGLEPGDDALLLGLMVDDATGEADLAAVTGLDGDALRRRIARLTARDLAVLVDDPTADAPAVALTEAGIAAREALEAHWHEAEAALLGAVARKDRKALRRALKRIGNGHDDEEAQ